GRDGHAGGVMRGSVGGAGGILSAHARARGGRRASIRDVPSARSKIAARTPPAPPAASHRSGVAVTLLVGLMVVWAGGVSWAEAPEGSTTTVPGAEQGKPATAYGAETPRGAMARFLGAAREGQY